MTENEFVEWLLEYIKECASKGYNEHIQRMDISQRVELLSSSLNDYYSDYWKDYYDEK